MQLPSFGPVLKLRAKGADEVRRIAQEMRTVFTEDSSRGGLAAPAWMAPERQQLETDLRDTIGLLNDRKLRNAARDLLDCWTKAFASAPPGFVAAVGDHVVGTFADTNREERERIHDQAVHQGAETADRVHRPDEPARARDLALTVAGE